MSRKMMQESPRVVFDQQFEQFIQEADLPMAGKTKVERRKMSSMAPNFRVVKFLHDEINKNKSLRSLLDEIPDYLSVTGARPAIMRLIADKRHRDSHFNLLVQRLTTLDLEKAKELKKKGQSNEQIAKVLAVDTEIQSRVKDLAKAIGVVMYEIVDEE